MAKCDCEKHSSVIDSRPSPYGIRRRRKCTKCGKRWTTIEMAVGSDIKSLKAAVALEVYKSIINKLEYDIGKLQKENQDE